MPLNRTRGPFQPGEGRLPPHLAGREREEAKFREFLEDLRAGEPVPRNIVLFGPRGNGKTALLRWLRQEVAEGNAYRQAGEAEIKTLWFTLGQLGTVESLAAAVASRSWRWPAARTKPVADRQGKPRGEAEPS